MSQTPREPEGGHEERRPIEDAALEGLQLAQSGDYGKTFQGILDMTGAGLAGQVPSPEGLALKALYHQSREGRGAANEREDSALEEITTTYNTELGPQATPVTIVALAEVLRRARRPVEQDLVANALEAAAKRLRQSGYVHGK
jgi:hypothetical protein